MDKFVLDEIRDATDAVDDSLNEGLNYSILYMLYEDTSIADVTYEPWDFIFSYLVDSVFGSQVEFYLFKYNLGHKS